MAPAYHDYAPVSELYAGLMTAANYMLLQPADDIEGVHCPSLHDIYVTVDTTCDFFQLEQSLACQVLLHSALTQWQARWLFSPRGLVNGMSRSHCGVRSQLASPSTMLMVLSSA